MAELVAVREISNEEGRKLLSIVRRGSGSVVRWRRAQILLRSAQHMDVPPSPRSPSPHRTGCGKSSTTSTGTTSTHWPPSTREADRRSSPCRAPGDQKDHPRSSDRPRRTVCHLVAHQVGRPPGAKGGGRGHQPRGTPGAPPRGGCLLSSAEDLEGVERPRLRGEEEPDSRALRPRRRKGPACPGRS